MTEKLGDEPGDVSEQFEAEELGDELGELAKRFEQAVEGNNAAAFFRRCRRRGTF
jgi:hypothetical protein